MRLRGLEVTPLAALSRAICGIRGRTLIVNLPGSPLGAVQSLQAVATPLKHALELIRELPEAERHGGLAE
jgi:molybdopterin biosynthesis enzyme MoaB